MIGQTISHYQILAKLGEGGMGVVYRARDSRLNRDVAIKVLPAGMIASTERRQRFIQEAQAASALNHPSIITIYDIGTENGTDFITMELVPGRALDQMIPTQGLPLREVLQQAVQIADAMSAAHGAGILHRDLKPGNVMVSEDGRVKVLDFGLAKLTETSVDSELDITATVVHGQKPLTVEGAILGTVSYMSPEQAEGKKLDARSDIFAFGSLLYEMLTGRRAFAGESTASTLAGILREELKPAGQMVQGLPRQMDRVVNRCLRKDRSRRWQNMSDIKVALQELLDDAESGKLAEALEPPPTAPKPALPFRWVAMALFVLAGVAVGWFVRPTPTSLQQLLSPVPLTTYSGREDFPSFSPDGNQVAFSWNGKDQDNFDIYVQVVGAGSPVRLTTDPAVEFSPAWSPDGRHIAFLRESGDNRAAVVLIPALGGAERRLAEVALPYGPRFAPGTLIDWFADSQRLVIGDVESDSDGKAVSLFGLDVETSEKWRLTSPAITLIGDLSPSVSPDGRSVAFVRITGVFQSEVYLLSLSAELKPEGEPRRITHLDLDATSPVWGSNGDILFLAGTFAGQRWLWRVAPEESLAPEKLLSVMGKTLRLTSSVGAPGSRWRIAIAEVGEVSNIWQLDIGAPVTRTESPHILLSSTREDEQPQFSPDGKRIAFTSYRTGSPEIWVCDADGANPVQLTSFPRHHVGSAHWSPDGREIVFQVSAENQADLYIIGAGGGAPRRLTVDPGSDETARWSHDGRWIYFASNRTGTNQIWKIPAAGGDAVQVTRIGPGFSPVESPDGRFIYFTKPGTDWQASVWRIPTGGGEEIQMIDSVPSFFDFAVTEDGIYFLDGKARGTGSVPLRFLDFSSNEVNTVSTAPREAGWGLAVSPDRRSILFGQLDTNEGDLMMLEMPE